MTADADRDALAWLLRQANVPHHKLAALAPDFLVISPPKTGSTWLAANLRCHPQVFVPAIKEVKYFSCYFQWLDLNWYLDQFGPAAGRKKGEASPSYALLPVERIRLIRRLLPDVKLIFLMRDPVGRAWSHARHNVRYREANFASHVGGIEAVSDAQWGENFTHEWPLASGDYLGQLRRWLSVFPREQFYVGFYESLVTAPEALLRDVLTFLDVAADVDLSAFRVAERILPGPPGELSPALRDFARRLFHERTRELAAFLHDRFGLRLPPTWETGGASAEGDRPEVYRREFDDRYLARVLALEESFPSSPRVVQEGYRGYDLLYYRGRLYAVEQAPGRTPSEDLREPDFRHGQECGSCLVAASLAELKERVNQHIFERGQATRRAVEVLRGELSDVREQAADLESRLRRLEAAAGRRRGLLWFSRR